MAKYLLLVTILTFLSFDSLSQIKFESGYFITDTDQRVNCLIRDVAWRNNPTSFEYKLSPDSEVQKGAIQTVKEFGVPDNFKFIRATVKMDRSREELSQMSYERGPVFQEERLFLRAVVEGKASLYLYEESDFRRYFYQTDAAEIQQLVYKPYRVDQNKINYNTYFRQQLFLDFTCSSISQYDIEGLNYVQKDLARLFIKYNTCQDAGFVTYGLMRDKSFFHLAFRPGVNISRLVLDLQASSSIAADTDFGYKNNFRFGIEGEFVLPFNKRKWSIIIEPTYQYFNTEQSSEPETVTGSIRTATIDYKSIELPLGVRHYFFLNKNSSLFLNSSFVLDFRSSSSSINFKRSDVTSRDETFMINTNANLAFGAGFRFRDRYSMEMRYYTSRNVLSTYPGWLSDYNTFSAIVGYRFL